MSNTTRQPPSQARTPGAMNLATMAQDAAARYRHRVQRGRTVQEWAECIACCWCCSGDGQGLEDGDYLRLVDEIQEVLRA